MSSSDIIWDVITKDTESLIEAVKNEFIFCERKGEGVKQLTEKVLCERLRVSRLNIREAMWQLEYQGLIERQRKKGSCLHKPSIKELVDMWDARSSLEATAARIACSNITISDINKLHELVTLRREAHRYGKHIKVDEYDILFHEHIINMANNKFILDIVHTSHLFDRIFRISYFISSYSPEQENCHYSHSGIIKVLEDRCADSAEHLMKCHIQEGKKRRIESLIGKISLLEQ